MSAFSAGDRVPEPSPTKNMSVVVQSIQHGEMSSSSSSSSSCSSLHPVSHADVATNDQLNMQLRFNADQSLLAASVLKGKTMNKQNQQAVSPSPPLEHKAPDNSNIITNSSSSTQIPFIPAVSPPLSQRPVSIAAVHCGVLCLDSAQFSIIRNSKEATASWVTSHHPTAAHHSVVDYSGSRYLHLHFRSDSDLVSAMNFSTDPSPPDRVRRCIGFSPLPCSGKKFPEQIKCIIAGFNQQEHENTKTTAMAEFTSFLQSLSHSSLLIDQITVTFSLASNTRVCYARLHFIADVHTIIIKHDSLHGQLWGKDTTMEAPFLPSLILCRECNGRGHMRDKCPTLQERTIRLLFKKSVGEDAKLQVAVLAQAQHTYLGVRRTGSKTILTSHCIHVTYRNTDAGSIAMAAGIEAIVATFSQDLYSDPLLLDLSHSLPSSMCDLCGDIGHRSYSCSTFDTHTNLPHSYATAFSSFQNHSTATSGYIHPSRFPLMSSAARVKPSRICFKWRDTGVCLAHTRGDCHFEHLDTTRNKPLDSNLCRDYQVGKCIRGKSCRFTHESELQVIPTTASPITAPTLSPTTDTTSSTLSSTSITVIATGPSTPLPSLTPKDKKRKTTTDTSADGIIYGDRWALLCESDEDTAIEDGEITGDDSMEAEVDEKIDSSMVAASAISTVTMSGSGCDTPTHTPNTPTHPPTSSISSPIRSSSLSGLSSPHKSTSTSTNKGGKGKVKMKK
jgi:hypothetical protein